MSDELLTRMSSALAEENQGESAAPGATRSRILLALHARKQKRRLRLVWGLPLVAVFAGSSAWATYGGGWFSILDTVSATFSSDSDRVQNASSTGRSAAAAPLEASESSADVVPAQPAEGLALPQGDSEVASARPGAALQKAQGYAPTAANAAVRSAAITSDAANVAVTSAAATENTAAPPRAAPSSDALATYQRAHYAQFRARDYGGALEAYAAYLRAEPQGNFALEARYNSAICALRLGRTQEAIVGLSPFAAAAPGSYRQLDARALLDAIQVNK